MGQGLTPYPYQETLADEAWPDIVEVPTGMGKTPGIILGWLYKRLHSDPDTPRRLVYCLPMRVLVEQTALNARQWIDGLVSASAMPVDEVPSVHVLTDGEIDADWDRYPGKDDCGE